MKKSTWVVSTAAVIFTSTLLSCNKEKSFPLQANNAKSAVSLQQGKVEQSRASSLSASFTAPLIYTACDRKITIYDPYPGHYTLAMSDGNSYRRFGLLDALGTLSFNAIDDITFEFSGLYADLANTVKLYRIRRQDGRYLTFGLNVYYSVRLQPAQGEELQLWIFNTLGNDRFNIILTKFGTTCRLARTYQEYNVYRLGSVQSGQTDYDGSTVIYIKPSLSLPPSTQ